MIGSAWRPGRGGRRERATSPGRGRDPQTCAVSRRRRPPSSSTSSTRCHRPRAKRPCPRARPERDAPPGRPERDRSRSVEAPPRGSPVASSGLRRPNSDPTGRYARGCPPGPRGTPARSVDTSAQVVVCAQRAARTLPPGGCGRPAHWSVRSTISVLCLVWTSMRQEHHGSGASPISGSRQEICALPVEVSAMVTTAWPDQRATAASP